MTRTHPLVALESNGLRVLTRLGFGEEKRNYAATYKSVQEAVTKEGENNCDDPVAAHQLLRKHGQEVCKSNQPKCEICPLTTTCDFYQRNV